MKKIVKKIALRYLARFAWGVTGFLIGVLVLLYLWLQTRPPLEYWHTPSLINELKNLDKATWQEYIDHEDIMFKQLEELVAKNAGKGKDTVYFWQRYNPKGTSNPLTYPNNWNRSFWLKPKSPPRFKVILAHGLSDSPYSLRSIGQSLHSNGGEVLGVRTPGHGLIPGSLLSKYWEQERDVFALAVEGAMKGKDKNTPLFFVGYSNGAALVVDYTIRAIEGKVPYKPDGIILLSPAMKITPLAKFAKVQRLLGILPGFANSAWSDIQPEYDPYKYNSFPVNAGLQIYELTEQVQKGLAKLRAEDKLKEFPPLLAFTSVADATIQPTTTAEDLMMELQGPQHELVLFDINNKNAESGLLKDDYQALLKRLGDGVVLPFTYRLISNCTKKTSQVDELTKLTGEQKFTACALNLHWPKEIYSLSHVALPFPSNDPVYGDPALLPPLNDKNSIRVSNGERKRHPINLGGGGLRGEKGTFIVTMNQLSRLRFNPFYSYIDKRVDGFINKYAP